MTEYTLSVNEKKYKLTDEFRRSIERHAELKYESNDYMSCWWKKIDGDPVLVIETSGYIVPWEKLDQASFEMVDVSDTDDDAELIDNGNGVQSIDPDDMPSNDSGADEERTHFTVTPRDVDDIPQPDVDDADTIPPEPMEIDGTELVKVIPKDPYVDEYWGAGRAITKMDSWVEWNVQARADNPRPHSDDTDSHDQFESLCRTYDCEVVATMQTTGKPDEKAGSVKRKGEDWYEGDVVGDRWNV